jgi:adenosylcobinamide kinase / adenosylcobinamide-phosphate guanylyltransferase
VIALLLGGASSGKSALAERLVATLPAPTTYVATATFDSEDRAMQARIAAHQRRRPPHWRTLQAQGSELIATVEATPGTLLVDALGTWVAGSSGFAVDSAGLVAALAGRAGDTVVVGDEVGLAVHPATASGRAFREALGPVNAAVAAVADHAWLVVAGRLLILETAPW